MNKQLTNPEYKTLNYLLHNIKDIQMYNNNIKNILDITDDKIKINPNTYFNDNKNNVMIAHKEIKDLHKQLTDKIFVFNHILNNSMNNLCEHDWINDLFDIGPDRYINIDYCSKCNITIK